MEKGWRGKEKEKKFKNTRLKILGQTFNGGRYLRSPTWVREFGKKRGKGREKNILKNLLPSLKITNNMDDGWLFSRGLAYLSLETILNTMIKGIRKPKPCGNKNKIMKIIEIMLKLLDANLFRAGQNFNF